MLRFAIGLTVAALAFGPSAYAQGPPAPPSTPGGPELTQSTARVEGDHVHYEVVVRHMVPVQVTYTVMKNGQLVTETQTRYETRLVMERRTAALKDVRAYVTGGQGADPTKALQTVDPTKLADLLRKNPRAAVAPDPEKLKPELLKKLPKGTVILAVPGAKLAPPPMPPGRK